jgi:hypothetical protein
MLDGKIMGVLEAIHWSDKRVANGELNAPAAGDPKKALAVDSAHPPSSSSSWFGLFGGSSSTPFSTSSNGHGQKPKEMPAQRRHHICPKSPPDFHPSDFEHPRDLHIKQLPIYDIDGSVVRPWAVQRVIVEGALISATVNLVVWVVDGHYVNVPFAFTHPQANMMICRQMYHFEAINLKVHHRPGQPLFKTVVTPAPVVDQHQVRSGKTIKTADGSRAVKADDKGKGKQRGVRRPDRIGSAGTLGRGAESSLKMF